jgi:hypothetical protein
MLENPPPSPTFQPAVPATKHRHGCLTAFLIAMILANAYITISYANTWLKSVNLTSFQMWALLISTVVGLLSILCAILIFRWKKIGFWLYCGLGTLTVILNLALGAGLASFLSLVSLGVLFGVLQIGSANKGWPQLE